MQDPVTEHFAVVRRITDLVGGPVADETLRPHADLEPGLFLLRSIEDPARKAVVAAMDETDLGRRVHQGDCYVWRAP